MRIFCPAMCDSLSVSRLTASTALDALCFAIKHRAHPRTEISTVFTWVRGVFAIKLCSAACGPASEAVHCQDSDSGTRTVAQNVELDEFATSWAHMQPGRVARNHAEPVPSCSTAAAARSSSAP
ncbi:hypothetical protein GCM10017602_15090 [Herbiconiux flava]|nr:hypothetical protein GCM10017602_15090 [Herbiconiux flava]